MFQSKLLLTFSKSVEASNRTIGADSWESLRWLQDGKYSEQGGYLHISRIITKQLVLCASAMILDQNKLKLG